MGKDTTDIVGLADLGDEETGGHLGGENCWKEVVNWCSVQGWGWSQFRSGWEGTGVSLDDITFIVPQNILRITLLIT